MIATIDLLAVFVAVADKASFSAAARELGVPTSTVSRKIATLEAELGVQLFHRTTRHVALSTAGAALHERVASHVVALDEAVGRMPEQAEEPSGDLRVTAAVDVGMAVLAELVARFTARHPKVRVELNLTNRVVDLVSERFDVALRVAIGGLADSSLIARKTSPLAMGLFAAPTYVARRGAPRTPRDLDGHDWVGFRGRHKLSLRAGPESATVPVPARITADDMLFVREAARSGAGVANLPVFLASADVAAGTLVRVLPRWSAPSGHLWVVSPASKHPPRKVTAFRELVIETLRARPLA